MVHNIQLKLFGPHGEIKESSRTNKYIMITNMMNQKRGLTDSINCSADKENSWRQITSLSICSKRKIPADRIWVKQQTRISIRNTHRKSPSKKENLTFSLNICYVESRVVPVWVLCSIVRAEFDYKRVKACLSINSNRLVFL